MLRKLFVISLIFSAACLKMGSTSSSKASAPTGAPYRLVEVARGLEVPWSIVFAPDGRMFVTERPGRLRVISGGVLQQAPLYTFNDVESGSEEGLMGLALHPDFASNHLLYVSFATKAGGSMIVRVVRFRETGSTLEDPATIVDRIPATRFHAGCRLKFGPDRKLYITTGDATEKDLAQKMDSLAGKILRVNDDGSIPPDNPFPGSPIWTLGHRNPQGIAWHPLSGLLFSTEHGPSTFDGPAGGDEVNLIEKGKNYGWPIIHHRETREGLESPVSEYTPADAPASAEFYRGAAIRGFENQFFFGCLRGSHLHRIEFDAGQPKRVKSEERLFDQQLGRIRDVAMGPGGALYFSTSNRDGRGRPAENDDRIFKLEPM